MVRPLQAVSICNIFIEIEALVGMHLSTSCCQKSYLDEILDRNVERRGRMLEHGQDGALDVDDPHGVVTARADGLDFTVVPLQHQRSFF